LVYVDADTFVSLALEDGNHFWRVRAVDNAGNFGDFSGIWSFELDSEPPTVPDRISPPDSAVLADSTPTFVWGTVTFGARSPVLYTFQYALDEDFTVGVVEADSLSDSTLTPDPMDDDVYYWRVRAFDQAGNVGDWPTRGWLLALDHQPPTIDSTTLWTDTSYAGPFEVETWVRDNYGLYAAFLYYSVEDTLEWTGIGMEPQGGFWWSAEIPEVVGYEENTPVYYYIRAMDLADPVNESFDPEGAPTSYYEFTVIGIEEGAFREIPGAFDILPVGPNPAQGPVSIRYAVPRKSFLTLKVYDVTGKHVRTLVRESRDPGYHRVVWDGLDESGSRLGPGVYYLRLQTSRNVKTRRLMLFR
jgi:hypothetical protein